ncbi:unnamed protein product [Urochloa humidicola]
MENNKWSRKPFEDLTNTVDGGSGSNKPADPRIRKNDMEKARYIARREAMSEEQKDEINRKRREAMSQEKKDEINRKRRESYARKNAQKK